MITPAIYFIKKTIDIIVESVIEKIIKGENHKQKIKIPLQMLETFLQFRKMIQDQICTSHIRILIIKHTILMVVHLMVLHLEE